MHDAHRLVQYTLHAVWRWHGQIKSHLFCHALPVAPIAVARRDLVLSPVTGTVSQTAKTNGIDRLLYGYLYHSRR